MKISKELFLPMKPKVEAGIRLDPEQEFIIWVFSHLADMSTLGAPLHS